jgi:hypothetical protein
MRILFHKLSEQRHAREIVRVGGARERVECGTRSLLIHDFLHAIESPSHIDFGWLRHAACTLKGRP